MNTRRELERRVRRAAVAGTWYPGTEQRLRQTVDGLLGKVPQIPLEGSLVGLISPHAGYAYSGQTAAYAYKQLEGLDYDTVVIMSPSHRASWRADFVISDATHYETPLGLVELDSPFIDSLARRVEVGRVRRDEEHSLEIQLPFLQQVLPDFRLVPVMIGSSHPRDARRLGRALAELIQGIRDTVLLVTSTDLHHIANYDEVVRRDGLLVDALASYDMAQIETQLTEPDCSVCGRMPVLALLEACRQLGADRLQVLRQTTSGDVTGDRRPGQYTVGYLAAAVLAAAS